MKLKLNQIENACLLLNHLVNATNNIRCDRYGGLMEITAWSGNEKKLIRVVEKTGFKPIRQQYVASCLFYTWRI